MRRNNLHVTFVMFSTSNVTPTETYTFIPVREDSKVFVTDRHDNLCDINPHMTTTVEKNNPHVIPMMFRTACVTLTETYTFIPVRVDSKVFATDTTMCATSFHTILPQ